MKIIREKENSLPNIDDFMKKEEIFKKKEEQLLKERLKWEAEKQERENTYNANRKTKENEYLLKLLDVENQQKDLDKKEEYLLQLEKDIEINAQKQINEIHSNMNDNSKHQKNYQSIKNMLEDNVIYDTSKETIAQLERQVNDKDIQINMLRTQIAQMGKDTKNHRYDDLCCTGSLCGLWSGRSSKKYRSIND